MWETDLENFCHNTISIPSFKSKKVISVHIEILLGKLLEQAPSLCIHQNVCKCQSNRIPANKWL